MKKKTVVSIAAGLVVLSAAAALWISTMNVPPPSPTIPAPLQTQAIPEDLASPLPEPVISPVTTAPVAPEVQPRFKELLAQNDDVIGWLLIPNTKVDYPVAQSGDNDYYLHRDLNRKKTDPGTLFMDFRNSENAADRHTVIYGHNMKNGTMFGTLRLFKKEGFYTANRRFTYSTLYEDTQWEIFSAYISPPTLDLIQTDFVDDAAFMDFITTRQNKSKYPADLVLKPTDKILTLITCTYEIPDGRFVIHARKVEK